jgi:hypothetical protein
LKEGWDGRAGVRWRPSFEGDGGGTTQVAWSTRLLAGGLAESRATPPSYPGPTGALAWFRRGYGNFRVWNPFLQNESGLKAQRGSPLGVGGPRAPCGTKVGTRTGRLRDETRLSDRKSARGVFDEATKEQRQLGYVGTDQRLNAKHCEGKHMSVRRILRGAKRADRAEG